MRLASSILLLLLLVTSQPAGRALAQTGGGSPIGLANPAATLCVQCGGTIQITTTDLGQTGLCSWPKGVQIEEWTFWNLFMLNPFAAILAVL